MRSFHGRELLSELALSPCWAPVTGVGGGGGRGPRLSAALAAASVGTSSGCCSLAWVPPLPRLLLDPRGACLRPNLVLISPGT